jgi:hypothetical protein
MKNFEVLDRIPTKRFSINGIIYNRDDVHDQRFTRVIEDSPAKGKLHVRWNKDQKAFVNEHLVSVHPSIDVQAREASCSGFLFNESDIVYLKD